jgi:Holliday junction resolvase RusA-like endonuclease
MSDKPLVMVTLDGPPVGKGRPRFRIVKPKFKPQFVTVYTDGQTAAYEAALKVEGMKAMAGRAPLDVALTVLVDVFIEVPASWSAKKRAAAIAGDIPAISRPDSDNYAKIALDGLNKTVWADDSLIVMLQTHKRYDDWPRLRVSVWGFDDIPAAEPELI